VFAVDDIIPYRARGKIDAGGMSGPVRDGSEERHEQELLLQPEGGTVFPNSLHHSG
jgi:hypothetical protein